MPDRADPRRPDATLVYVATKNAGKMRELRALFPSDVWRLETYDGYEDVAENETSYLENAMLKATALRRQLLRAGIDAAVLGDDSGLEVRALGGAPGVLSARYGGPKATWRQRREQLRAELARSGSNDRSARFVCALHFIAPSGRVVEVERYAAGFVATEDAGDAGFSYDATFVDAISGRTYAELGDDEKNRISHRGAAVLALLESLGPAGSEAASAAEGNQQTAGM